MQIHQGTHSRAGDGDCIRPYHCNVPGCGKSFTEKRNLNAHRRTRHTEVRLDTGRERVGGPGVIYLSKVLGGGGAVVSRDEEYAYR